MDPRRHGKLGEGADIVVLERIAVTPVTDTIWEGGHPGS